MPTRTRRRFDDDDFEPPTQRWAATIDDPDNDMDEADDGITYSTYPDATRGPSPLPDWVDTSPGAIDTDLGVFKTGKEADVSLVRRSNGDRTVLLAAKKYRDAQHRMFHRDAGYLEGRRMRKSRETRAVATRTAFGRELISGQWAAAEFAVLSRLWLAGAAAGVFGLLLLLSQDLRSCDRQRPRPPASSPRCATSSAAWPMRATPTVTCRLTTCWFTRGGWS